MEKDVFLKVSKNKYFNNKDLSPTKILILSQIEEFERNGKTCYITDETLADNFNVSISTINRAIADLSEKKYIIKIDNSKNENGKIKTTRQLSINQAKFSQQYDNTKNDEVVSYRNDNTKEENIKDVSCQNGAFPSCQNDKQKDNSLKDNIKEKVNISCNEIQKDNFTKEGVRIPKIETEIITINYKPKKSLVDTLTS